MAAAAALAAVSPAAAEDAGSPGSRVAWRLELSSDRHCDALPLDALDGNGWAKLAPGQGHNLAYLDDSLALARDDDANGWGWSLLARSHLTVVASEGALALARQAASGQAPAADARWSVQLRYTGFIGAGLEVRRRWQPAAGWTVTPSLQLLRLSRWRERVGSGVVAYNAAARRYAVQLDTLQVYDGLDFPYQQEHAANGLGLLPGLALAHQRDDGWFGALTLRDGGWLRWPGIPRQALTLNTERQSTDANGFLVYGPLVEGQNSQQSAGGHMAWRTTLVAGRRLPDGPSWSAVLDHRPGFGWLPALQWQRGFGTLEVGAEWRLHERRLTGTLAWRGLSLRLGADRLGSGARSREARLAWSGDF